MSCNKGRLQNFIYTRKTRIFLETLIFYCEISDSPPEGQGPLIIARDIKTMEQLINYLIDYLLGLLISITIKLGVNIFNRIKKIRSKHKHD